MATVRRSPPPPLPSGQSGYSAPIPLGINMDLDFPQKFNQSQRLRDESLQGMYNMEKLETILWENSRHFLTQSQVSPRIEVRSEEGRNSILMTRCYPDLNSASDWLEIIHPIPRHYPDLGRDTPSVWNFCARSSSVIWRETSGDVTKCRLFYQANRELQHRRQQRQQKRQF